MAEGYPRRWGLIGWQEMERTAKESLARVAPGIDPILA